jgi:hypothetical protein
MQCDASDAKNSMNLDRNIKLVLHGNMQSAPGFYSGHLGHMYPFFGKVLREICTEKRLRKMPFMCPKCPEVIVPGHKSPSSLSGTTPLPNRSGTCPVRCLVYRSIVKRHAMTGSGLGRYKERRPAPGFKEGMGGVRNTRTQKQAFFSFSTNSSPSDKRSAIQKRLLAYFLEPVLCRIYPNGT